MGKNIHGQNIIDGTIDSSAFDASLVIWNKSGSNAYYNDGNVGIGTSDPSVLLNVSGSAGEKIRISYSAGQAGFLRGTKDAAHQWLVGNAAIGDDLYLQSVVGPIIFGTNNTEKMRITSDGDVGIGTSDPSSNLHVYDDGGGNGLIVHGEITPFLQLRKSGFNQPFTFGGAHDPDQLGRFYGNSPAGVGLDLSGASNIGSAPAFRMLGSVGATSTTVPALAFEGYKSDGADGRAALAASEQLVGFYNGNFLTTNPVMMILGGGNVGIGTLTPVFNLDVSGGVNVTDNYYINGQPLQYTILEGRQSVTIVDGNANAPLVLDASITILEITLDSTLTQDWQPSGISGWRVGRTYLWEILKKSNNGVDLSVVRADASVGYDSDTNPFTALSSIDTTQQRAVIQAIGFKSTYGQFGSMIITDSNYVE